MNFFKITILVIAIIICSALIFREVYKTEIENQAMIHKIEKNPIQQTGNAKKRIMIFTSSGGRGHISATQALTEYLSDKYDIQPVYAIREILGKHDFTHVLTFGQFYSEDLYNYLLTHNFTWLVPLMVWIGKGLFYIGFSKITKTIYEYLEKQKPDLIISTIPMVNGATLAAAEKLNIPFWVIPTDLEAKEFIFHIKNPTYAQFFFNAAYDDASVLKTFGSLISSNHITYAGFPVRPSFLKSYDKDALKQTHDIPMDKPCVLLLIGGLGLHDTVLFAKKLVEVSSPMHLLICIGKNEKLRAELATLQPKEHITYSIIGFTNCFAELMAIADLFITKSGGGSVNEAIYMELPMILDGTVPGLAWEEFNRTFVSENDFGTVLTDRKNLTPLVDSLLQNPQKLAHWRRNLQMFKKQNPQIKVVQKVQELIGD